MFKNIILVKLGVVLFSVLRTKNEGWYNLYKVETEKEGNVENKKFSVTFTMSESLVIQRRVNTHWTWKLMNSKWSASYL